MEMIVYGASICIAFLLGAYVKSDNKKIIANPIKVIQEKREERKINEELERQDEIMKTIEFNIDNYDGTSYGQKEIPR